MGEARFPDLNKYLQFLRVTEIPYNCESSFYRTSAGAEIDLILRRGRRTLAFELKSSTVPSASKSFWNALDDISPDEAYVVAPVKESYPMKGGVTVSPLQEILASFHR